MSSLESMGFLKERLTFVGQTHDIYAKGVGPVVIVLHELPGLAPPTVRFAERLIDAGFRVYLPHLFGVLLSYTPTANYIRLCISSEFAKLRAGMEAPVTRWLRAVASHVSDRNGGDRVGVIGMCLTGAFVIPLILEPSVKAAIASQPAIPLSLTYIATGCGRGRWMRQLNVPERHLDEAGIRVRSGSAQVLALRYRDDRISPPERLERLREVFSPSLESYELECTSRWRRIFKPPHAVLTDEYDRAESSDDPTRRALQRVIDFLAQHLPRPAIPVADVPKGPRPTVAVPESSLGRPDEINSKLGEI